MMHHNTRSSWIDVKALMT